MLKVCGALMILTAPALLAWARYRRYIQQDRLLKDFQEALTLSAERIRADSAALPVLAAYLEQWGPARLQPFWRRLRRGVQNGDVDLDILWRQGLADLDLAAREQQLLEAWPRVLRSYDIDQVARELLRMGSELEVRRRALERQFQRNFKAQTGIQISAALLLLILLV